MDAEKPIYVQTQELANMWRELWWRMSNGIKSEYDRIKATNVFEFYPLFDLWREKIKQERKTYKTKSDRHGR